MLDGETNIRAALWIADTYGEGGWSIGSVRADCAPAPGQRW